MLINLRTIHTPDTLPAALDLLKRPGAYPVYGGGAALVRQNRPNAQEAVDLTRVVATECRLSGDGSDLYLGAGATLEKVIETHPALVEVTRADAPLTLRNALTIGDLLMEAPPNSLLLAALYGLGARVDTPARGQDDQIEIGRWYQLTHEERANHLIQGIVVPRFMETLWRFAFRKVSRTPADMPIVAAIGFAYQGEPNPGSFSVVCGLAERPMRYTIDLTSTISDYKGSAEYRTAMAKTLVEQALEAANQLAGRS